VTIFVKRIKVASTVAPIVPRGLEVNELTNAVVLDDIMRKTVYCLNAVAATTGVCRSNPALTENKIHKGARQSRSVE
jgi:hypothetical protein